VRTAAVGPKQGPETLFGRTLLNQQATQGIEEKNRKSSMQNTIAIVALAFAQKPEFIVVFINPNQWFGF
jgi:hypothetical protein